MAETGTPAVWLGPLNLKQLKALADMHNIEEHFPNGLKVSKTDNPMLFPVENAYQVGSAEILALCSNAIAVGTGQTGSAPLYVFCADGIYALFVDAAGEMAYTNARVIARDVVNNPRSVTPTDQGVVFTTDRGLMMIAGEQVHEIGEPAEGDVLQFADSESKDYIKIAKGAFTKVAELPIALCDQTDFLSYLTGAIVNYNHNERELMVSNPDKPYSYILDRNGNWSRRDYTADEYVNNYPTSYRLRDGEFYKVNEEGDSETTLEHKKEADNRFFYLSHIIKLGSIGFKEAHRLVVRGHFESVKKNTTSAYPENQSDPIWQAIGSITKRNFRQDSEHRVIMYLSEYMYNYMQEGDDIRIRYTDISSAIVPYVSKILQKSESYGRSIYLADAVGPEYWSVEGEEFTIDIKREITPEQEEPIGVYVFGSYDGRRWAMLGGNEKRGTFTDIGCKIERTDMKFFRVCLAGQITGQSRIDYMEISSLPSVLNTKIR